MQPMTPFVFHIVLITIMDLTGILSAKYWSINKNPIFLMLTVLCFGCAGFVFARSLRYEGMAIMNIIWMALSIIFVTIAGYFIFKEEIAPIQIAGMVVITIGLVLVNLK
ncbi:MAG: EamA family transporter [Candidatus Gracilibacteria bacterium]|jgi:multidrug transporter EmrE-like cation transporter